MTRILVYEPLSADAPDTRAALGPGSAAQLEMLGAGRDMRDAIAGDLAGLPGIDVTMATGQQEAGHALPVRTVTPGPCEGAASFVRRQSQLYDLCWIVAPESDGLLLRLHGAVGARRWIGSSAGAIRIAASKHWTCAVLQAAGIATPLAFAPGHRGPWIVKPDDGAGTLRTRRHSRRAAAVADVGERSRAGQAALLEPFVAGEPLSISVIVGPVLARTVAFNRQRISIDENGWLHDIGVQAAALPPSDPRAGALEALATRVSAALPGVRGYVGIDVVWNRRDGPVVIEVNPRVTCAYVGLSALLGRNLAGEVLAAHDQQPAARHACA
jgi:predicted ATP-grasp superfamily ATP-dependent carboligase